jgi:multidrug efflux system membrane fusion protein
VIARLFVTFLAVTGVAGCAAPRANEPPAAKAVRVVEARVPDAPRGLRYAVTIQPAESVTLALKASGYVASLHQARGHDGRPRTLQPGDAVRAGAVLVRVRDAEYVERLRQAEGGLDEATASHVKARLDLDRALSLFAAESLTVPERDAAQASFDTASARVLTSRAHVEAARLALADCVLTAPIDGVVLERRIESGMLAGAGTVAFVLGRVAEVKAVLGVPDSVVSRLAPGQSLTMTTEAFPGAAFPGTVTGVAPSADPQSRVFAVEVTLPNRDGRLRPGMIGAIELASVASRLAPPDAVAVPLAAIVRTSTDAERFSVFVIESAEGRDIARARSVTLGATAGNTIAVTDGIRQGERVVVMGATLVLDGEPVRIIP